MTIKEIAKKTLAKFKNNAYVFTPDEYAKVFCQEARKAKVIVKDCNKVAEFIKKLDQKYQLLAKNYNIKTLDELIVFLINYLNRENKSKEKESLENLFMYTKRALDVLAVLPILKSKNIAIKHLDFIKPYLEKDEFDKLRKEWFEFLSEFDDSIVRKGAAVAGIKSEDALVVIDALIKKFEENPKLDYLVDSLVYTLTPSYAPYMNDEIAMLKKQLKEESSFILSKAFAEDLKILTDKRIKLDKEELKKKLKDLEDRAKNIKDAYDDILDF
jgi:tetrahydromethanopterin S-methyltransferase subunit B